MNLPSLMLVLGLIVGPFEVRAEASCTSGWSSLKRETQRVYETYQQFVKPFGKGKLTAKSEARAIERSYPKLRGIKSDADRLARRWREKARQCTGVNRTTANRNAAAIAKRAQLAGRLQFDIQKAIPKIFRVQLLAGDTASADALRRAGFSVAEGKALVDSIAQRGQWESIKWIAKNAPTTVRTRPQLIHEAIKVARPDLVDALLAAGLSRNYVHRGGLRKQRETPLESAMRLHDGNLWCTANHCKDGAAKLKRIVAALRRRSAKAPAAALASFEVGLVFARNRARFEGACAAYLAPYVSTYGTTISGTVDRRGRITVVTGGNSRQGGLYKQCNKRVAESLKSSKWLPATSSPFTVSANFASPSGAATKKYGDSAETISQRKEEYALANPGAKDAIVVYRGPTDRRTRKHYDACKAGSTRACAKYARIQSDALTTPVLSARFLKPLEATCKTNSDACELLAHLYRNSKAEYASKKRAVEFAEKGCELDGSGACVVAGFAYSGGRGVSRNKRLARMLWSKACDLKHGEACAIIANLDLDNKPAQALSKSTKSCRLGSPYGCWIVSSLYCNGSAGVAKAARKCRKYLERFKKTATKLCMKGDYASCDIYGFALTGPLAAPLPGAQKAAAKLLGVACDHKYKVACQRAGKAHLVDKHYKQAAAAFQAGCDQKDLGSCKALAALEGQGRVNARKEPTPETTKPSEAASLQTQKKAKKRRSKVGGAVIHVAPLAGGTALSNTLTLRAHLRRSMRKTFRLWLACKDATAGFEMSGVITAVGRTQIVSFAPSTGRHCLERAVKRWKLAAPKSGPNRVSASFRVVVK